MFFISFCVFLVCIKNSKATTMGSYITRTPHSHTDQTRLFLKSKSFILYFWIVYRIAAGIIPANLHGLAAPRHSEKGASISFLPTPNDESLNSSNENTVNFPKPNSSNDNSRAMAKRATVSLGPRQNSIRKSTNNPFDSVLRYDSKTESKYESKYQPKKKSSKIKKSVTMKVNVTEDNEETTIKSAADSNIDTSENPYQCTHMHTKFQHWNF